MDLLLSQMAHKIDVLEKKLSKHVVHQTPLSSGWVNCDDTMTWTANPADPPDISTVSHHCEYVIIGGICIAYYSLEMTAGFDCGTGGSGWIFRIPKVPSAGYHYSHMQGWCYDSSTAKRYPFWGNVSSFGAYAQVTTCYTYAFGDVLFLITETVPFTWANDDMLVIQAIYAI